MKKLITNYIFDASEKKITFSDYVTITLENVLLITNVTDNIIIYLFSSVGKGGTVATNVLTLDYNTTTMDDSDDLQIFYDDLTTALTDAELRITPISIDSSDILRALRLIQQSVYKPPWFDGSANALRMQAQSGTITTVTTVTTVTNMTNFGSQSADMVNRYNSIQSWSLACRGRIS